MTINPDIYPTQRDIYESHRRSDQLDTLRELIAALDAAETAINRAIGAHAFERDDFEELEGALADALASARMRLEDLE